MHVLVFAPPPHTNSAQTQTQIVETQPQIASLGDSCVQARGAKEWHAAGTTVLREYGDVLGAAGRARRKANEGSRGPKAAKAHHPLLAIFGRTSTAFCTNSMGSHDTLRHCQRARACRCGGEKSRALRQGTVFQLFVQMALWDTLGSGMD